MAASRRRVSMAFLAVLSLALLFTSPRQAQAAAAAGDSGGGGGNQQQSEEEYRVPVRRVVYRPRLPAVETAAVGYQPFELCDGCRCCSASNASSCVATSCCYAIDCDLPGKPFGTCAFTPQTCGCGGDANCTQPPS